MVQKGSRRLNKVHKILIRLKRLKKAQEGSRMSKEKGFS